MTPASPDDAPATDRLIYSSMSTVEGEGRGVELYHVAGNVGLATMLRDLADDIEANGMDVIHMSVSSRDDTDSYCIDVTFWGPTYD